MIRIHTKVKYDIEFLKSIFGLGEKFQPVFTKWAEIYRAAMQERFIRFARGGGTWAPLAPSTILGRKRNQKAKGKKKKLSKGDVSILIDTGTLWNTLQPTLGAPGQVQEILTNGVSVGIGGNDPHPSGSLTIGQLATFHQEGKGRLPKREILVEPSQETLEDMTHAMDTFIAMKIRSVL